MIKQNLTSRLKNSLLTGVLAGYLGLVACAPGGSSPSPPQPPQNRAPVITLNISPTSGVSPLEIRIQGQCTDPDGQNDILNYKVMSGSQVLTTTNPTDMKHTLLGNATISSECSDRAGERVTAGPINVQVLQPELSQILTLENFIDIDYRAVLTNVPSATRTITHDGNPFGSPTTITTSPYNETFDDVRKGLYGFILKAIGATTNNISLNVPNYLPKVDFSSLNTDISDNEGTSKTFNLESLLSDRNPEDRPVLLNSATTLSGDVSTSISGYNLSITAVGAPGPYQVEVNFGSGTGGFARDIIRGNVSDLVHLTGQLQDARTNTLELKTNESGIIHVYNAADNTLLKEYLTDSQGNFDFKLDQPGISEIFLQARIVAEIPLFGIVGGGVRTIKIPGRDTANILVRAYPHNEIIAYAGIGIADLRKHLEEVNPFFLKSRVDSIEIIDVNPVDSHPATGRAYSFSPGTQDFIKNKILDPNDIGCLVDPVERRGIPLHVQIDTPSSEKHYSINNDYDPTNVNTKIVPHKGWVIVVPVRGGGLADRLNDYMFRIELAEGLLGASDGGNFLVSHELGHAFIAPYHHSSTLNGAQTIMGTSTSSLGIYLPRPGPADCEAGKVIYESTYERGGIMNIIEGYDNTLGLDFCIRGLQFCPKK